VHDSYNSHILAPMPLLRDARLMFFFRLQATDRDAYGGRTQYTTTIKPTSKFFNDQHEWHVEGYNKPPEETPQEIIQQLVSLAWRVE
jgi:hypothetical protein